MGPKRRRITRAYEGHSHARPRRGNYLLANEVIGRNLPRTGSVGPGPAVDGANPVILDFNQEVPSNSEPPTLDVLQTADLDNITAVVSSDNVQPASIQNETGVSLEAAQQAVVQQSGTTSSSTTSVLTQIQARNYAFMVSAKPNLGQTSDMEFEKSPHHAEHDVCETEVSALPFNVVLGFMLKCGGGYLSDRQYEDMRFLLQATGKGIAQDCRTKFSNEASIQAVHYLHEAGILRRQYLASAISLVVQRTNEEKAGGRVQDSTQAKMLQEYALPSLSTLKRRLQPGGSLEHLLLPAIPIFLRRKRNVASVQKQGTSTDSEDDESESEASTDDEGGDVLKAGVILLSSHIKRDMESELTYSCIMSGVRGSKYWEDTAITDNKSRSFCETDIAISPADTLDPAAYGFEGVSDTEWPDVLCQGCEVVITVRGLRNAITQNTNDPLSTSVHTLRGVISGSPQLVMKTPVACEHSVCAIDVHPGDYEVNVLLDAVSHRICRFSQSTRGVQCTAKLVFRAGTEHRRVTLSTCRRLYVVENLSLSECDQSSDADPTNLRPGNVNSRLRSQGEQAVLKSGCWVNDKNENCIQIYISIFSDDFRLRKQGTTSAGGVYFLYLSMPLEKRSGAQACRVLGITPPDCDSACIVDALLHDLIVAQNDGVLCKDPKGNPIRVFATLSFYVADYAEIGHTGLAMGHSSQYPCSLCAVSRGHRGAADFHAAKTSSLNLALVRTGSRLDALRKRNMDWSMMGLKDSTMASGISDAADSTNLMLSNYVRPASPAISPLLVLSKGLGESFFDPFLSFVAGPDHGFFLGTGKDTLSLAFALLPNENSRKSFEGVIVKLLRSFGFKKPQKILSGSPTPKSPLTSLSCSEVATAVSVLPIAMSVFSVSPHSWHPLDRPLLHKLLSSVLCLLRSVYSSSLRSDIFTDQEITHLRMRLRSARELAENVIDNVRLCGTSSSARMRVEIEKVRKPNLHRILEFVSRTLPMIRFEVRHLCELLFEKAHKFAKIHFGQTAVGPDEAWNCLRKLRERELCDRFHVSLQSKSSTGEYAENEEDRNMICLALRGITGEQVSENERLCHIVERMKNTGSRGLIVQREDQEWVSAKSQAQSVHQVLHVGSSYSESAVVSLNQLLVDEFNSSTSIQIEDFETYSRSKASCGKSPSPHKEIAVGQVLTFTRSVYDPDENSRADSSSGSEPDARCQKERIVIRVGAIQDLSSRFEKEAIYCYGEQLKIDSNETARACELRVWTKTGNHIWCKLDQSSRRAAAASWNRIDKRVDMRCPEQHVVQSFVLLLPMDGYPLRLA